MFHFTVTLVTRFLEVGTYSAVTLISIYIRNLLLCYDDMETSLARSVRRCHSFAGI